MKNIRYIRHASLLAAALVILLIGGCAEDETKVEPTYSSLWDNVFSGCNTGCHLGVNDNNDTTAFGPDFSTKASFYDGLNNKTVSNYPEWAGRAAGCDTFQFISGGNVNQTTLAAALILSVSEVLDDQPDCDTAYNTHEQIGSVITDEETKAALIGWIESGAANN